MSRTKPKPRSSILDVVAAEAPVRVSRSSLPAEAEAEAREVFDAIAAGTIPAVGCERLAKILKERHGLTSAVTTLAKRLQEMRRS